MKTYQVLIDWQTSLDHLYEHSSIYGSRDFSRKKQVAINQDFQTHRWADFK